MEAVLDTMLVKILQVVNTRCFIRYEFIQTLLIFIFKLCLRTAILVQVEIRGKWWVMTFFSIFLKFLLNISCLCSDKYASYWCRLLCRILISGEQMQYFNKKYSKNTPLTLKLIIAEWMNYKWIQMRFLNVLMSIQVSRFQMPHFNGAEYRKNTPLTLTFMIIEWSSSERFCLFFVPIQ